MSKRIRKSTKPQSVSHKRYKLTSRNIIALQFHSIIYMCIMCFCNVSTELFLKTDASYCHVEYVSVCPSLTSLWQLRLINKTISLKVCGQNICSPLIFIHLHFAGRTCAIFYIYLRIFATFFFILLLNQLNFDTTLNSST